MIAFVTGTLIPYLAVLTVLIFVHEMGHYLVARWAGVRVEVFSIGFGPELFGRTAKSGTRWRLSAIPIGGYVQFFGDADATSTPGEAVQAMSPEDRAVSFHHKSVGARAAVTVAGPAANFLLAILVYSLFFMTTGQPNTPPEIGSVMPDSAAAAAGLQAGDRFVSIDGTPITRFEELVEAVQLNTGTPMQFIIDRGGKDIPMAVTPKVTEQTDHFGNHVRIGMLGVQHGGSTFKRLNPLTAVVEASRQIWNMCADSLKGIGQIIIGTRSGGELSGPIGIAKLTGQVAQDGLLALIPFMALISVQLGLVNLFPIPVLDGGRLVFYAAEAVLGRPLGQRTQEFGFRLGLALVLMLMVFATWNDLDRYGVFSFLKGLVT